MAEDPQPAPAAPFWRRKTLSEMDEAQWESLCDGCAKCCLHKLENAETGEVFHSDIACRLLDADTCRCRDYAQRQLRVPDCVRLSSDQPEEFVWLPRSCAYRRLMEGRDLPRWHPLVCGDPRTVHTSGNSVRGRVVSEIENDDIEQRLVEWVDGE